MKLSQLQHAVEMEAEGVDITIFDPLGNAYTASDGSEVTVTVIGMQTTARRAAEAEENKAMRKVAKIDDTYLAQRRGRLAFACCTGWHGWESESGEPIEFTKENVVAAIIVDERVLFQIEQGIERHAYFLAKSRTS